jgi:hypothetical protein
MEKKRYFERFSGGNRARIAPTREWRPFNDVPPTSPSLQRTRGRVWRRAAESPLFRGVCASTGFERAPETVFVRKRHWLMARKCLCPSAPVPFGAASSRIQKYLHLRAPYVRFATAALPADALLMVLPSARSSRPTRIRRASAHIRRWQATRTATSSWYGTISSRCSSMAAQRIAAQLTSAKHAAALPSCLARH